MPLPICKKISDWEIGPLFNSYPYNTDKLKKENPQLYKLILIAHQYEQERISEAYDLGASIIYSLLSEAAKPNKLPIVSKETLDSTLASFFSEGADRGIETYKRMFRTDKTLEMCILYVIETDTLTDIEKDWICKAFAQFYELLRRHVEAKDMEEMFL